MDFDNKPYDPALRFSRPEKAKKREDVILAKALEQPNLGFDTVESAKIAIEKFHSDVCEFFFRNGYGPQLSVDGYYAVFDEIVWHRWFLNEQYQEHFVCQIPAKERLTEPPWSDDYIGYWWRNFKRIPGVLVLRGEDYVYQPHQMTAPDVNQAEPHRADDTTISTSATDDTSRPLQSTETGGNPVEKPANNATEAAGVICKDGEKATAKKGGKTSKKISATVTGSRVSKPTKRKSKGKKVRSPPEALMVSKDYPRTRAGRRVRASLCQAGRRDDGAAAEEEESFQKLPDNFKEPKTPEDPDKD